MLVAGNKSVDIKFGVLGGTSISGESGKLILDQLTSIAGKISSGNKLKVKVSLDTSETEKILTQQMREIVKSLSLGGNKEGMAFFKLLNKDIDQYVGKMKKASNSIDTLKAKLNKNQTVGLATALTKNTYGTEGLEYYKKSLEEINVLLNKNDTAGATKRFSEMFSKLNEFRSKKIISDSNQKSVEQFSLKIKKLNDEMEELGVDVNQRFKYGQAGVDFFADNEDEVRRAINSAKTIEEATKAFNEFKSVFTNEKIDFNNQLGLNKVTASIDEFKVKFGDILSTTNASKIDEFAQKVNNGFYKSSKEAQNAWLELKNEIAETGGLTETVGQRISRIFKEKLGYGIIASAAMMARRVIRQLYTNVVELDSAVVDLQIASGKTRDQVKDMMSDYAELGQKLGVSTVDIAASADTWLRQGYTTVEETQKLITASQELAVLGQLNSSDAATYLTSMMKGYQLSVEDAENVVSKLVKVDMEAATSAGDLAEAIKETANSARLSGVSLDELIGYITTVAEVTQMEAGRVGTAYKTMFARMAAIKDNMLEDPETGESLGAVESTLNGLGIKLRESNSEFRDFSDVLDDVAANWDSYSSVQQRAIAKAFGNTRNQEVVLTLFENYDQALKYTETSLNSAGTAQEKYKSYTDSVEASQKALTAAFQDFSQTLINSDAVKVIFDMATGFTNLVTEGARLKALLPTLLSLGLGIKGKTFGGALNGFNQRLQLPRREILQMYNGYMSGYANPSDIAKSFLETGQITDSLTGKVYKLKASELELIKANLGAKISQEDLKTSTNGTVKAFENLKGGIKAVAINLAISAAVWALSKGFEWLAANVLITKKAFDDFENTVSDYTSKASEVESLNNEIAEAVKRIAELQEKANNGTITLVEQAELDKLKEQNNQLKDQLILTKNLAAEKSKEAQKQFKKLMGNYNVGGGLNDFLWYDVLLGKSQNPRTNSQEILDYIKDGDIDKATEKLSKYKEALIGLYDAGYSYGGNKAIDEYIDQLHDFDLVIAKQEKDFDKYLELISSDPRYAEGYERIVNFASSGISLESAYLGGDKSIQEFIDKLNESGLVSIETKDSFKALENQILGLAKANEYFVETQTSVKQTLDDMKSIEEAYDKVAKAYKEFADDGRVGTDTLIDLRGQFADTVANIDDYILALNNASNVSEFESSLKNLYEAYLNSNSVIEMIKNGEADILAGRLKAVGVINAEAVIENKANQIKFASADITFKQFDSTEAYTQALVNEAVACDLTAQEVALLTANKDLLNKTDITSMTAAEVSALISLGEAAGWSSDKIARLAKIESYLVEIQKIRAAMETADPIRAEHLGGLIESYRVRIDREREALKSDLNTGAVGVGISVSSPSTFAGASSSSSSSKDAYKEAFDDWYAQLKYMYDTDQITQETYLKRLNSKYKAYYKDRKKYDEEYRKYNQEVYEGYKSLLEKDYDNQKEALEKQKDLLNDRIKAVDDAKDKEIDALDEIYEARKEALETQKDNEEYEREQSEKRTDITKLTAQISELEKDTSASSRSKVLQLREQLLEAQDALTQFETDKAYENQMAYLEKEQAAKQDAINKKFEDDRAKLQSSIDTIEQKVKDIDNKKEALEDDTKLAWSLVVAFAKQQGISITSAYASGTNNAYGGWARTQEAGSELVAKKLKDGSFATYLPQGSKVFNSKATDFLYSLANSPLSTIKSVVSKATSGINNTGNNAVVSVGDIVINGNADSSTVAELKKARKEMAYEILTEFKRLQAQ